MARPTGTPKTGGRTKGTPNKKTEVLKEIMAESGFSPFENLIKILPDLEPSLQAKINLDLMAYIYPKRKAVDLVVEDDQPEDCPKCSNREPMTKEKFREEIKLYLELEIINDPNFLYDLLDKSYLTPPNSL